MLKFFSDAKQILVDAWYASKEDEYRLVRKGDLEIGRAAITWMMVASTIPRLPKDIATIIGKMLHERNLLIQQQFVFGEVRHIVKVSIPSFGNSFIFDKMIGDDGKVCKYAYENAKIIVYGKLEGLDINFGEDDPGFSETAEMIYKNVEY